MRKIATPQDLQSELKRLLAYCDQKTPSRTKLAAELRGLAVRLAKMTQTVREEMPEVQKLIQRATGDDARFDSFGIMLFNGDLGDLEIRTVGRALSSADWDVKFKGGGIYAMKPGVLLSLRNTEQFGGATSGEAYLTDPAGVPGAAALFA